MEKCILSLSMIICEKLKGMDLGLCAYIHLLSVMFIVLTSPSLLFYLFIYLYRPASSRTASQPKSIAVTGDLTVFISEIDTVEAFRSNQKVFELKPKFQLGTIAAHGSVVVIGEVGHLSFFIQNFGSSSIVNIFFFGIRIEKFI